MSSNRVKFCPKEGKVVEADPEFVVKSFKNLLIGESKNNSHFVINSSSSSQVALKSHYSNQREKFDSFFSDLVGDIYLLSVTEKERDTVYQLIDKVVGEFSSLVLAGLDIESDNVEQKISDVQQYVLDKIHRYDSSYKREKELHVRKTYVPPDNMAIGLTWATKVNIKTGLPDHTITQPTFQYVPILKTLKSLFIQPQFKQSYFESCFNPNHTCEDEIFKNFCCSSVSRNSEL